MYNVTLVRHQDELLLRLFLRGGVRRGDLERRPTGDLERRPTGDLERRPTGDLERRPTGDLERRPGGDLRPMGERRPPDLDRLRRLGLRLIGLLLSGLLRLGGDLIGDLC